MTPDALSRRFGTLLTLLIVAGCAKPAHNEAKKPKEEKPLELPVQTVETNSGSTTQFSADPTRERQWDVAWEKAEVDFAKKGPSAGTMQGVSGKIYQKNAVASTFRAQSGLADKAKQTLMLVDDVHVYSPDPKDPSKNDGELMCDRLVYDAAKKIVKAQGHVRFVGTVGTIGTLSEVWATPKLDKVATPDLFDTP